MCSYGLLLGLPLYDASRANQELQEYNNEYQKDSKLECTGDQEINGASSDR
jgi:hypothetical protein